MKAANIIIFWILNILISTTFFFLRFLLNVVLQICVCICVYMCIYTCMYVCMCMCKFNVYNFRAINTEYKKIPKNLLCFSNNKLSLSQLLLFILQEMALGSFSNTLFLPSFKLQWSIVINIVIIFNLPSPSNELSIIQHSTMHACVSIQMEGFEFS